MNKERKVEKMNKTLITAIVSVIVFIVLVINTIFNTDFQIPAEVTESIATLIAVGIMWAISNYWNQDYTATARKFTSLMRRAKKLIAQGDATLMDLIEIVIEEAEKTNMPRSELNADEDEDESEGK